MKGFTRIIETAAGISRLQQLQSEIIDSKSEKQIVKCPKCNGLGGIKSFAHVQDGVCFLCKGAKTVFSYLTSSVKINNKKIKCQIMELQRGYYIDDNLINEFCAINDHQNPFFYKISDLWFANKLKDANLPYGIFFTDYNYAINCNNKFMFE